MCSYYFYVSATHSNNDIVASCANLVQLNSGEK